MNTLGFTSERTLTVGSHLPIGVFYIQYFLIYLFSTTLRNSSALKGFYIYIFEFKIDICIQHMAIIYLCNFYVR